MNCGGRYSVCTEWFRTKIGEKKTKLQFCVVANSPSSPQSKLNWEIIVLLRPAPSKSIERKYRFHARRAQANPINWINFNIREFIDTGHVLRLMWNWKINPGIMVQTNVDCTTFAHVAGEKYAWIDHFDDVRHYYERRICYVCKILE